ncbi:MAG: class I SAM-dependent methyltransferase [Deltaproteobacteria bacterium]
MTTQEHWNRVYTEKDAQRVSWYRPHLHRSLAMFESIGVPRDARIIDIGGGASTLVDDLLDRGYTNVTVLDVSSTAIEVAKARLGDRASQVTWVVGDATTTDIGCKAFDVWHDRAVFHFLTDASARRRYIERLCCSLATGGHVVIATFALDGPEKCSGLPVARYSAESLIAELDDPYVLVDQTADLHETPWGSQQSFTYCLVHKAADC